MLARIEPFWSWHTPIAWTGFILVADGWIWKLRGNSPLRSDRAEMMFLAAVSVPLWIVFELYNKYSLQNWHYIGLPESRVVRYFGYAWAFATIWPAILIAGELFAAIRHPGQPPRAVDATPVAFDAVAWTSVVAGGAMLLVPIAFPSPWLAAPVWLGFICLLDPMNAANGSESLRGDFRAGSSDRLLNLLAGGLLCGILWECWNYWARSKWIYTVPVPPHIKIFEMPVAGYLGFPAFAVECFVMYVFVRRLLWHGSRRPIAL